MTAWIANLRDAALERRGGASEQQLEGLPPELADLYREMDGATLLGDVRIFPLQEAPYPGAVEGMWRFGQKGAHQQLLTLPRAQVAEAMGAEAHPSWLPQVPDSDWIYGVKEPNKPLRLFRTLESMLGVLVPPPVEEFGENTYARAFTAVQAALENLSEAEGTPVAELVLSALRTVLPGFNTVKELPAKGAPKTAKKAAPKKAAAKKAAKPARKAAKKSPAKKASAKKAKRPAPKKSAKKPARRPAKPARRAPKSRRK